ncbi:hypothetical protein HG531_006969 [Fusarium graminearum]|nr:hypothetical protein HG531_006969 [Fusarium graminearum]
MGSWSFGAPDPVCQYPHCVQVCRDEPLFDIRRERSSAREQNVVGRDTAAVQTKAGRIGCRIPVVALQASNTLRDCHGKVIISKTKKTKSNLELLFLFLVVTEKNVVDGVGEFLGDLGTVAGRKETCGLKVLPVINNGFGNTGRGDATPEKVGVDLSRESSESTSVGATVDDVRGGGSSEIVLLHTGKLDMLRKVSRVGKGLLS